MASLKPFKYNKITNDEPISLIDGCYVEMVRKNVIPKNLIPFANDWGGNFFCLNKFDNSIVFYTTDSFRSDYPMNKNHELSQRKLACSFNEFMSGLIEE